MVWPQILAAIVLQVIAYALTPKPQGPRAPTVEDLDAPTAEEGRPIPVVFGTITVTGPNVLWYGDLATTPVKKGGK